MPRSSTWLTRGPTRLIRSGRHPASSCPPRRRPRSAERVPAPVPAQTELPVRQGRPVAPHRRPPAEQFPTPRHRITLRAPVLEQYEEPLAPAVSPQERLVQEVMGGHPGRGGQFGKFALPAGRAEHQRGAAGRLPPSTGA